MPINYQIDPELGVVFHDFSGDVTTQEFEQYWRQVLRDPELPEPLVMVADLRGCHLNINGAGVQNLVGSVIEPLLAGRRWTAAAVIDSPVEYGVTKQFQAYTEGFGTTEVFSDMDAAVEWAASAVMANPAKSDH